MDLWLKYREPENLIFDRKVDVSSQEEWSRHLNDPRIISSILWPTKPRYLPHGPNYVSRKHQHEKGYVHDAERNASYLRGCRKLAERLNAIISHSRVLVYAPLRGALPIWRAISQFVTCPNVQVCFSVTSSFVKRGSFNHWQELLRLKPFLSSFNFLVYADEIVSGGMMRGHLKVMRQEKIHEQVRIVVVGLADDFGRHPKAPANLAAFEQYVREKWLAAFLWEGCSSLITEDQKFLLGVHYVDYSRGPHVVPVLDSHLEYYEEKRLFDQQVMKPEANM